MDIFSLMATETSSSTLIYYFLDELNGASFKTWSY